MKVIFKFIGAGYMDEYQVRVKIFKNNKEIVNSKTFNGEICLMLEKNKIYKLEYQFLNSKICTSFYTNSNKYIFILNQMIIRTITLSLRDYYYNIPIEKGEIILWQK